MIDLLEKLRKIENKDYSDALLEEIMIVEGKSKAKKLYVDTGKVSQEDFDDLVDADPSGEKGKYIEWMCYMLLKEPDRKQHIKDVVRVFDEAVQKGKIKGEDSDIYRYKSFDEIDRVIEKTAKVKTRGEKYKEIKSEEAEIVADTPKYKIVVPKTHEASKLYGAHTKWCTAAKSPAYWEEYFNEGVKFYYIMDKEAGEKYAVAVYPGGKKECYDAKDKPIDFSNIMKRMGI